MKLFGSKKTDKKEKVATPSQKTAEPKKAKKEAVLGARDVIVRPRVTEKAANLTSANVFTFDVRASATKLDVAKAVAALYKVKPVKVRVVNLPAKKVRLRTRRGFGTKPALRKAYVYLKKGDSITIA